MITFLANFIACVLTVCVVLLMIGGVILALSRIFKRYGKF